MESAKVALNNYKKLSSKQKKIFSVFLLKLKEPSNKKRSKAKKNTFEILIVRLAE